jgi:ABC-type uncharacterized transport system substrate-binding protein
MHIARRSLLVALTAGVLGTRVLAQTSNVPARVVIVSSDASTAYTQAAQALTDSLVRQGVPREEISQVLVPEMGLLLQSEQPPRPSVFVALGSEATQLLVARNMPAPVLSALIPRRSFERILRSHGKVASAQLSAIQLDQPLARQLALIRLALPQDKRLGVLWGPESSDKAATLRVLASANGLELREATVSLADELPAALAQVIAGSDVLLALADPSVFNSNTIQNILMSSFHARIPLVAFSPAYVRAGAVLAVYTTPVQAGNQVADVVLGVLRGRPLPDHVLDPNDFDVGVNAHVARVLDVAPDAQTLRFALRRLERLP